MVLDTAKAGNIPCLAVPIFLNINNLNYWLSGFVQLKSL